jgi:hypothetical protein
MDSSMGLYGGTAVRKCTKIEPAESVFDRPSVRAAMSLKCRRFFSVSRNSCSAQ